MIMENELRENLSRLPQEIYKTIINMHVVSTLVSFKVHTDDLIEPEEQIQGNKVHYLQRISKHAQKIVRKLCYQNCSVGKDIIQFQSGNPSMWSLT